MNPNFYPCGTACIVLSQWGLSIECVPTGKIAPSAGHSQQFMGTSVLVLTEATCSICVWCMVFVQLFCPFIHIKYCLVNSYIFCSDLYVCLSSKTSTFVLFHKCQMNKVV